MKKYIKTYTDISEIPDEYKHGDCFVQALNTFLEDPKHYALVHGVVNGQGPLEGIQYCHAWVIDETTDKVIDRTLPAGSQEIPTGYYYWIGKPPITREYNAEQVGEMVDKYGTYGPWDKVFKGYP